MARSGYAAWRSKQAANQPVLLASEALSEMLRIQASDRAQRRTPFFEWALKVPEPKAGTLNFEAFPFQLELYQDGAGDKEAVVKKATQVGVSTYLVRWTMYWADVKGLVALYVFPTVSHVYDFSDQRMMPVIELSEYLKSRIPQDGVMNKGLKRIGLGFVYFRGSESKRGLDSVDADVLALDEYDTLTQANIGDAERRLSSPLSPGLIRRIGVPSINDFGISKEYERSDQRVWLTKCEGCGEDQPMRFKENVKARIDGIWTPAAEVPYDPDVEFVRVCHKCDKPIDVARGRWVAKYPDRRIRGYHMPRLIVPIADVGSIVKASKMTKPYDVAIHHNKDLAEAYEMEGARLTRDEIRAAQREYHMLDWRDYTRKPYVTDNLVTAGIDVASTRALNVRVSEHLSDGSKKALWIGAVDYFENDNEDVVDLDKIMRCFGVKLALIDHMPERRLARAFQERHRGRVYLVKYTPPDGNNEVDIDEELGIVSIKRVLAIDTVIDQVRNQRNLLPKVLPYMYEDHLIALVRRVERDEWDKVKVAYESTDADDYMHAEAYDVTAKVAWTIRQTVQTVEEEDDRELEDFVPEFQRSTLADEGVLEYSEGFERDEDGYSEGF